MGKLGRKQTAMAEMDAPVMTHEVVGSEVGGNSPMVKSPATGGGGAYAPYRPGVDGSIQGTPKMGLGLGDRG